MASATSASLPRPIQQDTHDKKNEQVGPANDTLKRNVQHMQQKLQKTDQESAPAWKASPPLGHQQQHVDEDGFTMIQVKKARKGVEVKGTNSKTQLK